MDGRKSFIFSWNKKHRAIHEEALLHYFDWSKQGQKFEYQPRISPEISTEGKEIGTENKNIPRKCDDRYQVKHKYHLFNPVSWYTMEYFTSHAFWYTHEP